MKILVIGASGRLGSEFCKQLAKNDLDYFAPTSSELNITDIDSVKKYFDSHAVSKIIFCAAFTAVDLAESEPEKCFLVNETGVKNVVENFSGPIIHFSTDFVFDGKNKAGYEIDAVRNPINVYGKSKLAAEKILENSKNNWANIRISSLLCKDSSFLKFLQKNIEENSSVNLWSENLMVPTFAHELVAEVIKKFVSEKFESGHCHLPSGQNPVSWYDLAVQLFPDSAHLFKPVSEFKTTAERPLYSILIRSSV